MKWIKNIVFLTLIIFLITTILGFLGFNTFLNWRNNQYYEEKKKKLGSSQEEEDKQLDRELKRKQKEKLDGFNPANKGILLTAETVENPMGIESLEYEGQQGQLIFSAEVKKHFLAILTDLNDLLNDGAVDPEKDEKKDNYSPFLKRRNTIMYGAPGTGKTCFIDELFWQIENKFASDLESIDSNNPHAPILQQQINNSIPPIFKINGAELQTAGKGLDQPDSYQKLIAIVKYLKQDYFGDEYSPQPYIIFVEEADQGVNVLNKEKGKLLEDWKNFLSTSEDKAGLKANAQDPNSIIIIATNNYENLDPALVRRGRLGKKLNFNWTPQLFKEYSEKRFGINWPKDKAWDFNDSQEYENLYSLTARFGYDMARHDFANNARRIIDSYNKLKKEQKEAKEDELGKRKTGKKVKDSNGNGKDETICNWLLHYLYTFHRFNYRQDLASFTNAEQIQRFDYGKEFLSREKLLAIRNGIASQLKGVSDKLQEFKEEINHQGVQMLNEQVREVKSNLSVVENAVRILTDQVTNLNSSSSVNFNNKLQDLEIKLQVLQSKVNNLPANSGGSSLTANVDQITKEAIKKITQKLGEL